jgi:hypothetical protein
MFTVEHMPEDTIITTLDQSGKFNDVEVIMDAESVFIRQWSEDMEVYDLIELSNQQLKDIIAAMNSTEGAYYAD